MELRTVIRTEVLTVNFFSPRVHNVSLHAILNHISGVNLVKHNVSKYDFQFTLEYSDYFLYLHSNVLLIFKFLHNVSLFSIFVFKCFIILYVCIFIFHYCIYLYSNVSFFSIFVFYLFHFSLYLYSTVSLFFMFVF